MTFPRARETRLKILIAEVEQQTRLLFQTLNLEWDVRFVDSGAKVMQHLDTFFPDLLILDVEMKGGAAHLVARAIKQSPATQRIPIVFLTSHCDAKSVDYHRRAGADYIVVKPLTYEKLRDIVHDILLARDGAPAGEGSHIVGTPGS
jgi:CheY-like chemotaxis protein